MERVPAVLVLLATITVVQAGGGIASNRKLRPILRV